MLGREESRGSGYGGGFAFTRAEHAFYYHPAFLFKRKMILVYIVVVPRVSLVIFPTPILYQYLFRE